jgi:hypothetical protein
MIDFENAVLALGLSASLLGLSASLLGCAAPCEKVQSSYTAFRKATLLTSEASARPTGEAHDGLPHLSLSLPYEVVDAMIAKELGRVPSLAIPLPEVAGTSLGKLRLSVDSVRGRSAPAGELGFRVSIGLHEGKQTVLTVDVDARLRPHINPRAGTLEVSLAGRDIVDLAPSISKQSRKQLGDWIWAQLPPLAKNFVDREAVATLAGQLADDLMKQAANKFERELLDDLGELVHFEFDLPEELPIRGIALAAGDRYLDIDLHTDLRVEHGLAPGHLRSESLHPNLIQVRVSGDAAAALANHAIREGRIPGRWTLEGEPDDDGELYAGAGWANGKPDALELHLWKLEGDCAHVVLRGEPTLSVEGRELVLGTAQAKVESVTGSAKVRAGLFFSKTARKGVELLERTTAATTVEIGQTTMNAQITTAAVERDEIVMGLRLTPARPR